MPKHVLQSDLIRTAREELGLTQAEAAELLKTSERNYRRWEAGTVNGPDGFQVRTVGQRQLLHALSSQFGIPPEELVSEHGDDGPASERRAPSPLFRVPLPSQRFVGRRHELGCLFEQLDAPRASACIGGPPGIGKTELALHVAHALAQEELFPGGVFWFAATDGDLTDQWASDAIAERLHVRRATPAATAAAAVAKLSDSPSRVLLVLDDVTRWSRDQAPRPLPEGTHVATLVTTRQRGLGGSRFHHLELPPLGDDDARELLLCLAGARHEGARLEDLLRHLDGYTLALEIAGVFLRDHPEVSPERYLADIAGMAARESVAQTSYEATLEQALQATWDALRPETRRAWLLGACFESEPFSEALADACGLDTEARQTLLDHHLLTRRSASTFVMHQLIRAFARRHGRAEETGQAERRFVKGCVRRLEDADFAPRHDARALDASHHEAALRRASECGLKPMEISELANAIGCSLEAVGKFVEARERHEQALELARSAVGRGDPAEAQAQNKLARTLRRLGDLETAQSLLESALATQAAALGEDHQETNITRGNLGLVAWERGELDTARTLMEQALDCHRAAGRELDVARMSSNLALVLFHQDDLTHACALARTAVSSALEADQTSASELSIRRANLALVLRASGDLEGARDQHERALASLSSELPPRHPQLALARANLATVLTDLGELESARQLLEEARDAHGQALGDSHVSVARDEGNLAIVLTELGRLHEARDLLERVLKRMRSALGDTDALIATWKCSLGDVMLQLGQHERALELAEQALASDLQRFADGHRAVRRDQLLVARVLEERGDLARALSVAEQMLSARLPKEWPAVAEAYALRSSLQARLGHPDAASSDARSALDAVARLPAAAPARRRVEQQTTRFLSRANASSERRRVTGTRRSS